MAGLKQVMLKNSLQLGLATDGDADRFGVMDEGGEFIFPNELIAMLIDYLVESRQWTGGVARSVATTHLIDRVAKLHGLELLETPVGFKYIGEYIKEGRIILGAKRARGSRSGDTCRRRTASWPACCSRKCGPVAENR
jgi:phosphomannomutase